MKKCRNGPQKTKRQKQFFGNFRFPVVTLNRKYQSLCLLFLSLGFVFGCATTPPGSPKPKMVETTIRINSLPPGAFVMLSPQGGFDEKTALALGKTPLLRHLPLSEDGGSIQITKTGYHEWTSSISSDSPKIEAVLVPFTEEEKKATGWLPLEPSEHITVIPMRVGIRKVGKKSVELETSDCATEFTSRFMDTFNEVLKARFGKKVDIRATPELENAKRWEELEATLRGIRIEKIGFYPQPLYANISPQFNATLASIDGVVLLLRAEAYYIPGGKRFARVAVPILLTAGSAAVGYNYFRMPFGDGSFIYPFMVFGLGPKQDLVLVQMFLIHTKTKELLWFSQVQMPNYFKQRDVTKKIATKAAQQIPSAFLK